MFLRSWLRTDSFRRLLAGLDSIWVRSLALGWAGWVAGAIAPGLTPTALAQIIFDGTLGPNNTLTGTTVQIPAAAGWTVGTNLFHSFNQFNVNSSQSVVFETPVAIGNILARVTGGFPSQINGRLATQNRPVNLFLINPAGISFGPGARLAIGNTTRGAFVATTTDTVLFPGGQFRAVNPNGPESLLTITGNPIGFTANLPTLAPIIFRLNNISPSAPIRTNANQSLVLLGGSLDLNQSLIASNNGRVELGAIAGPGSVSLVTDQNNLLQLQFPSATPRGDVLLRNGSDINISSSDRGSIGITAGNLTLTGQSALTLGTTAAAGSRTGNIILNLTDTLTVQQNSSIANRVFSSRTGTAGDIDITARQVIVQNSQVSASVFGNGQAGRIVIRAADLASLSGQLPPSTSNQGLGSPGGVFAQITNVGSGNGGSIDIQTRRLEIRDGSKVQTATFGRGNAGSITINAQDIVLSDSRPVGTNFPTTNFPTAINAGTTLTLNPQIDRQNRIVGNVGSITLTSDRLSLNNASITIDNFGATAGEVGNLNLTAHEFLLMQNSSFISANAVTPQSGNGSNILINAGIIVARANQNNDIFANSRGGAGGQVTINAQSVLGLSPLSRQQLIDRLGTTDPDRLTPRSLISNDITAISQISPNLNGVITLNSPDADPSRSLTPLSENLVDPTGLIAQNCRASAGQGAFVTTGRGGIPLVATDPNTHHEAVVAWVVLPQEPASGSTPTATQPLATSAASPPVEAQGWYRDRQGALSLVTIEPQPVASAVGIGCR